MATGCDTPDEGLFEEDAKANSNSTNNNYDDEAKEVEEETTDALVDNGVDVITLGQPSQLFSSAISLQRTARRKSPRKHVTTVVLTYSLASEQRS